MEHMRSHPIRGRRASLLALTLVVGLTAAACSSDGTEVRAEGDPASDTEDATTTTAVETTTAPDPTTTTEAPPPPTTVPLPPTTITAPAEVPCPSRDGDPVKWSVEVYQVPDGLEVGDDFACGRVYDIVVFDVPEVRNFLNVHVWDEADFQQRTSADPNVKSAEKVGYACAPEEEC